MLVGNQLRGPDRDSRGRMFGRSLTSEAGAPLASAVQLAVSSECSVWGSRSMLAAEVKRPESPSWEFGENLCEN